MRISATDTYTAHACEVLEDCERRYCPTHRLLWRDCETVKEGTEGDRDVIGGTRTILELGDCPRCEHEYARRALDRLIARHQNAA